MLCRLWYKTIYCLYLLKNTQDEEPIINCILNDNILNKVCVTQNMRSNTSLCLHRPPPSPLILHVCFHTSANAVASLHRAVMYVRTVSEPHESDWAVQTEFRFQKVRHVSELVPPIKADWIWYEHDRCNVALHCQNIRFFFFESQKAKKQQQQKNGFWFNCERRQRCSREIIHVSLYF